MVGGALVLWLVFRDETLGAAVIALRTATAEAARLGAQITGLESVRLGTALYHPHGFAIEISRGCTGFVGTALVSLGVLAYPAPARTRMVGIALAVPIFLAANLVRLVHLFHLGVAQSAFFHSAHEVLWQVGLILIAVGAWVGWVSWADRGGVAHPTAKARS